MAEQTGQERTEQATEKRKSDARNKGEVLRSKELTTFLSLAAAGIGLLAFGGQIISDLLLFMREHFSFGKELAMSANGITLTMDTAAKEVSLILLPFLLAMLVAMTAGPLALGGWIMNFSVLAPKYERIDPLKGFGRIFSPRSLVELVKALCKFFLVAGVVILVIGLILPKILSLPSLPLFAAISISGSTFLWCFLVFSSVLIAVVAMDVPFQVWSFNKKLKMTKQEIKDEMKETEGRPEVKSAIREKQQEFARQRMMSAVPEADVVITNPTHYAVALKYDELGSGAPVVVAKGCDLVAANIRRIAEENKVTMFSAPPLARALFASTDINQQIPENLFLAVAQVLAYVFQLKEAGSIRKKPKPPKNLPVPGEYESLLKGRGNS